MRLEQKLQIEQRLTALVEKIIIDLASLQVKPSALSFSRNGPSEIHIRAVDRYPKLVVSVVWIDDIPYVYQRGELLQCKLHTYYRFPFSGPEHNTGKILKDDPQPPYHEAFDDESLGLKIGRLELLKINGLRILIKQLRNKIIAKAIDIFLYSKISSKKAEVQDCLALMPGITFKVESLDHGCVRLVCTDAGGIYDPNPGFENVEHPAQVTEDLYGSSYAALMFLSAHQYGLDQFRFYEAGINALKFVLKNYHNYPGGRLFFRHHDFKNACIYECKKFLLVKDKHLLSAFSPSAHPYDPTNVHALRIHWLLEKKNSTGKLTTLDKVSYYLSKFNIQLSATRDGFIRDNFRATDVQCNGLSYHQFSLACLARAYDISNKKWLKKYFYKASQFTQAMQLSNGEIGYTGRGANSIYHLCSGIYGMALDFKTSSDPKSLENCLRSVSYLESHVTPSTLLPTCLNEFADQRMGWNATSIPYNAQSAYFLHHSLLALKNSNVEMLSQSHSKKVGWKFRPLTDSGFARIGNEKINIVVSESGASRPWSGYHHHTGAGGLASLSICGLEMLLHLDYSVREKLYVSDMPTLLLNNSTVIPSRIWISDSNIGSINVFIKFKEGLLLDRRYDLTSQGVRIETKILKSSRKVIGGYLEGDIKIPIRDKFTVLQSEQELIVKDNDQILCTLKINKMAQKSDKPWDFINVKSNTQGKGLILQSSPLLIQKSTKALSIFEIII